MIARAAGTRWLAGALIAALCLPTFAPPAWAQPDAAPAFAQPPAPPPGFAAPPPTSAAEGRALADTANADPAVRLAAIPTLAHLFTPAAIERLWLMAHADREPRVRMAAIEAMASRRDPNLAGALRAIASRDPDPEVRAVATKQADLLDAFDASPGWAAGLSVLCAGCGHLYLGETKRGLAYLGSFAALLGAGFALGGSSEIKLFDNREGPRMTPTLEPLGLPLLSAGANLGLYSAFDAYRRVRLARNDEGYRYPVSRETLLSLSLAPFRPRVLARPWFWAGLPVIFGTLLGYSLLAEDGITGQPSRSLTDGGGVWFLGRRYGNTAGVALAETYWASLFLPVGVGEESLFRGVIQPALTETFGLWPGWAVASLLFGAAHIPNFFGSDLSDGLWALPFITSVGGYMGAVAIKTGFQLETSVAIHFWYDFLVGTLAFIGDPDHQPFAVRFRLPL
ncbi:MAG TPA: CPBP family glutamic-type intramembrane protease [Polyangia bacterium]